jgi:hypothetical protein
MPADLPITDERPGEHRAGAWVVLIMGLIGLGLGAYQWRASFRSAFASQAGTFKTPDQVEQERIETMKTKDTDNDTLNDFEETYVYKTSPYLDDSDSDGTKDAEELKAGEDPNCPKGKSCIESGLAAAQSPASVSASGTAQIEEDAMRQLLNPTPTQIRALLVQNGVKESDLSGIDDATLLTLYQQSLQEVQANADKNSN